MSSLSPWTLLPTHLSRTQCLSYRLEASALCSRLSSSILHQRGLPRVVQRWSFWVVELACHLFSLIRQHGTNIDWSLVQVARDGKYLYNEEFAAYAAPQVRTDHAGAVAAVVDAVAKKPRAWYYVCGSDRFMR